MVSFFVIPIAGFYNNELVLPFKVTLRYDYSKLTTYIPSLIFLIWGGIVATAFIVAESNLIATLILHLNGRYLMLQNDLKNVCNDSLLKADPSEIAFKFRKEIQKIITQNMKINMFSSKLQDTYSFRIFIMLAMSSLFLCVLGFKIATVS